MPTWETNQAELDAFRRAKTKTRHSLSELNEVGRIFSVTHQTPSTDVTGQTSFVATTPTFMIYGEDLARRGVLRRMRLCQSGTVAGGTIYIAVAIDTTNRFSANGTTVTPQNYNAAKSIAATYTARYNPTASAAGTGTRYLEPLTASASLGTMTEIDFSEFFGEDGLIFAGPGATAGTYTGSLLVYTWAGTTGPSWKFKLEYLED